MSTIPSEPALNFDPDTGEIIDSPSNAGAYTVSEISHALKRSIEDQFGHVRVRGEITGFRGPHSSGHCYFSLKDEGAKIDAVIWRGSFSRMRSKLQEGLEVIATGKLTSYPGKSSYQIIIESVEPAGAGALMALLEERRRKLAAEGLFDQDRKQPIPYLPELIGVVTSPTGAVIRDILHRLNDRFPRHVLVWPVRVQGDTAAAEVAAAIRGFNAMKKKPDLLIVARGGGSLEDLWPFNEEIVVRAVADGTIPLISAVGHETDTTLIDHVSDFRAPTPTAAAERAVPVRRDLIATVASVSARQGRAVSRLLQERKLRVKAAGRALPKPDDILALARQRLDSAGAKLPQALRANLQRHQVVLARSSGRLSVRPLQNRQSELKRRLKDIARREEAALKLKIARARDRLSAESKMFLSLSYKSVLARGYVVVRDARGTPLHLASSVKPAAALTLEFSDGVVDAVAGRKGSGGGQGSLF
jgi:exodeoxyribonuclease VII large subunit